VPKVLLVATCVLVTVNNLSFLYRIWDAPAADRPNVVLVVLDTTRADRVSCYGYGRPTTPALDRLASSGVRFAHAYANSSWTLDSHASLFTGLYPVGHRATQETLHLGDGPETLAQILTAAGYQTFGTSANPVVGNASGLVRGFERFVEAFRSPRGSGGSRRRRSTARAGS
jgi:arylsulfatase A-like enzyme